MDKFRTPLTGIVADASCVGGNGTKFRDGYFHGRVEWQAMDLETGELVLTSHVQEQSTVNIGEYIAIVDALKYLNDKGDHDTPVYSDSKICINWVKRKFTSTNLPVNNATRPALNEMVDAYEWLMAIDPNNPVLWWNKYTMGENPADFRRK